MRYELKKVGVWSFIKISFLFNIAVGFIGGLCVAVFWTLYTAMITAVPQLDFGGDVPDESSMGAMLIILPFFGAIVGGFFYTMFAAVVVMIYNLLGRMIGGVELELKQIATPTEDKTVRPIATRTGHVPPPPPLSQSRAQSSSPYTPPPISDTDSPEPTDKNDE